MKKTYITPSTVWVFVQAEALLGIVSGGVDGNSIVKESDESMGRRGFSFDDDYM